jgi:Cytochrome c
MSKPGTWGACAWLALVLAIGAPVLALAQDVQTDGAAALAMGQRLYNQGVRADGSAMTGNRPNQTRVSGADAACVNCHRRSGMGQVEGDAMVPPINGTYLYAPAGDKPVATMDPHVSKMFNQAHPPYTAEAFSNAVRNGINNRGRLMKNLMPHFDLNAVELDALSAYLKQLSSQWSPGVTLTTVHFATVITPEVSPLRRKTFIEMMRRIVRQKNGSTVTGKQERTRHHMVSAAEMTLGTERNWTLDIWELQGAPETWDAQLNQHYSAKPVFALLSGLSDSNWQPVHDFCDQKRVPCWFPSVDVPGNGFSNYDLYFSAGVKLEAEVLAHHLRNNAQAPKSLVQIYRDRGAAATAALALKSALADSSIVTQGLTLRSDLEPLDALRQVLAQIKPQDSAVFWLEANDLVLLNQLAPKARNNYFSMRIAKGGVENLNPAWRANTHVIYPYELPALRAKNLDYFHSWLGMGKMALVDEAMQSEVFFAMNFMSDTLSEMLSNFYRDYLVERAENMLGKREGIKSEQETRDRVALGREGDLLRKLGPMTMTEAARIQIPSQAEGHIKSLGTTMYPNLNLAPDQRFASKGGYVVRFVDAAGKGLIAESDFIVPH